MIEFKTDKIKILAQLGFLLVISSMFNAIGDTTLFYSTAFLAFVVPVLIIQRKKSSDDPDYEMKLGSESELTNLGSKILSFMEVIQGWVDSRVPQYEPAVD